MRETRVDLIGGVLWAILGIALATASLGLRLGRLDSPGPGFLPLLTGVILALLGTILALQRVLSRRKHEEADAASGRKFREAAGPTLLAAFTYAFLLEPLGFVIATALFLFVAVLILGARRLFPSLLFSVVTVAAAYLLFVIWLQLRLPEGILAPR